MVLDFKNPFGLVQSQPQLNLPSTITPITPPTQKPTIGNKNQQLGSMLYALGGALRGDKNFVENTMQLQNIQDAKKREKEMKENWQKALGNLEGSVNPTLVELARVVGPEKGAGLIASGIGKEKKLTADQENYKLAVKQGYEGTFMDYMKEKKAPLVTIDQGQKVFEQEAAKAGFKTQQQAAETVEGYSDIENRLDILAKQLEGADPVKTGVIEEIKIPFKKIAAGLNILPQNELDKLSQQELFQATTNYIISRMRVAGSGSTSDREIELFKSSVPNLGNTVEGNKTLVGGLQAIAKYNKKRLFEMDKYLKNNGNLLGFGEFADNQLGPIYETFTSDDDFDKKVRAGKLKKGDFVYDAISGQFRVLSEADIKGAL